MNPFLYPKTPHQRKLRPGPYKDYRSYKPHLRQEFEKKCVYCRSPDTVRGDDTFGVDHYRPKKKFPRLEAAYENLFYACNACNARKGDYWPSPADIGRLFIPNPCDHEMFRHLRFVGGTVEGRTDAGRHTVELLDFNDGDAVAWREMIQDSIAMLVSKRNEYANTLRVLSRRESMDAELAGDIEILEAFIGRVERSLAILCGL